MTYVLNFSHPLADDAVQQLTEQFGELDIRDIRVSLDMSQPLTPQLVSVADAVEFSPSQWQTQRFVVVLPGMSTAAGILLAEIHGRCGHFPRIVVLMSGEDRVFRLSEVVDLQTVRGEARFRR